MTDASGTSAERFRKLAAQADSIAAELTRVRERLALTEQVDRHALSGAIEDANGCRTWCEFLERRAAEAQDLTTATGTERKEG